MSHVGMAVARADDDVEILKVVIVNGEPEIYKTNVSPHASAALAHGWSAQCSLHRKLVSLCSHHDSVAAMCLVRLTQSRSAARGAWETRELVAAILWNPHSHSEARRGARSFFASTPLLQ
jgi:hypothetical protein